MIIFNSLVHLMLIALTVLVHSVVNAKRVLKIIQLMSAFVLMLMNVKSILDYVNIVALISGAVTNVDVNQVTR